MAWHVPRVASLFSVLVLSLLIGTTTAACNDPFGLCSTQLRVCNKSNSNRSHTVLIDGINFGVVEVDKCREFDVAPGSHIVQIQFTNTSSAACSPSLPTVEKCKGAGLSCTG